MLSTLNRGADFHVGLLEGKEAYRLRMAIRRSSWRFAWEGLKSG
jgi:hypothetical protein